MRTKTLLLTAALSAAGIATSMAQVYSVNAVGYVNTTLLPGFNLVSNPLDNKAGNTIANLFGNGIQGTVPDGLVVYYYDSATDNFVTAIYTFGIFEPPNAASQVIPVGEGAFVFNPGTGNLTNTFVGEVAQGTASNQALPAGFSIKASTVAVAGTATELELPAQPGDVIYKWDAVADSYVPFLADPFGGGWAPSPNIAVGEAFFLFKNAAGTWTRDFDVNNP